MISPDRQKIPIRSLRVKDMYDRMARFMERVQNKKAAQQTGSFCKKMLKYLLQLLVDSTQFFASHNGLPVFAQGIFP